MLKNFFECFLTRSGYEKNFSNSFLPIWRTLPPIKRKLRKKKKYFNAFFQRLITTKNTITITITN